MNKRSIFSAVLLTAAMSLSAQKPMTAPAGGKAISDELDMAFDAVILLIKYLSNNALFSLEEKTKFYWKYIKGFLKISGMSKGNKFQILKEGFDSMIVEQIMLNDDDQSNKNDMPATKKINRNMI